MASASVIALGVGGAFPALESLGLFRANGPIAAHLLLRMHRLPPGVVFVKARIPKKHGPADNDSGSGPPGRQGLAAGLLILPRLAPYVYGGKIGRGPTIRGDYALGHLPFSGTLQVLHRAAPRGRI